MALSRYDLHLWLATGLMDDAVRKTPNQSALGVTRDAMLAWQFGAINPWTMLPTVTLAVANPLPSLTNVAMVNQLDLAMPGHKLGGGPITVNLTGYEFKAAIGRTSKAVFCCHGHAQCTPGVAGIVHLMQAALTAGHDAIVTFMPAMLPGSCSVTEPNWDGGGTGDPHGWLYTNVPRTDAEGSPARFFVGLQIAEMNRLWRQGILGYSSGLSGGGGQAALFGALDRRVRRTYPVAGTQPLYMRTDGSVGDAEQWFARQYEEASWIDFYAMASSERRMVLIFNDGDTCCFGPTQYSRTGAGARILPFFTEEDALDDLKAELVAMCGAGSFDWLIDMTSVTHEITPWTANFIVADIAA